MSTLIEMIMKVSVVASFLFQGLASDSYPNCLVWVDSENLTFRLQCIHKKKKGYTLEMQTIFLDYFSFNNRKSVANGQGKRSLLLQAIKASPYVEIDKSLSTSDEKFCRFTEKFKKLLDSTLKDFSLTNEQEGESPSSTSFGSALLQHTSESVDEFENFMISSTSGPNMPQTAYQSSTIASETVPAVPDVDMTEHPDDGLSSFYHEDRSSGSVHSHNSFSPNGSLQSEPSVNLPMREESLALYPLDYDPQVDLLGSLRNARVSSESSGNIYTNSLFKESSAIEIRDVCSVERIGNGYRILKDGGPNTPSSSVSPKYYMVTFNGLTE